MANAFLEACTVFHVIFLIGYILFLTKLAFTGKSFLSTLSDGIVYSKTKTKSLQGLEKN